MMVADKAGTAVATTKKAPPIAAANDPFLRMHVLPRVLAASEVTCSASY